MNGPFLTERAINHSIPYIADFQFPIADFKSIATYLPLPPDTNRQSAISNRQ